MYSGRFIYFLLSLLHYRHLIMVLSSLIDCVKQFLLIGLFSLGIVIAIIRASITKILANLREAGLSPLFIFTLLGILSICGIATIQCRACRRVNVDEESGIIIELEVGDGESSSSMGDSKQVNHFLLDLLRVPQF